MGIGPTGSVPTEQAAEKKAWHSTYYNLLKSFVNDVLDLAQDAKTKSVINEEMVAKVLRDETQLQNAATHYQSELELTIENIAANHAKLNVTKPAAAEMYKHYQNDVTASRTQVTALATNRAALLAKIKTFQENKNVSMDTIRSALKENDQSKATAILSQLASEAEKLKKEIKDAKDAENKLMASLTSLRGKVVDAVKNTVSPTAVLVQESKEKFIP